MSDLVNKAKLFATIAHTATGQKRKISGAPYIVHPETVAQYTRVFLGDASAPTLETAVAAAWLHDVVEDTEIDLEMIQVHFGGEVRRMVDGLTKTETKEKTLEKLAALDFFTATIKLCDVLDNCADLDRMDAKWRTKFVADKLAVVRVLKGNQTLKRMLLTLLTAYEEKNAAIAKNVSQAA